MYQFKAKYFEVNTHPLRLGNISKNFTVDYMKKSGLQKYMQDFSNNYNNIDVDNIDDTHKHLTKKGNLK